MTDHQVQSVAPDSVKSAAVMERAVIERESGLQRKLSARQVAMIGLGCTIGTGLFLGSAIAVKLAGPAVLLSFLGGAFIALTVMWALAEMSAEHPTAGAFGLHAEMYLHPWAGFAIRYTYWLCLVVIIGSEVVAAAPGGRTAWADREGPNEEKQRAKKISYGSGIKCARSGSYV